MVLEIKISIVYGHEVGIWLFFADIFGPRSKK